MTKSAIATTNTDVINNLILILENMKLDSEIDNYEDIKKLMSKATNVAIKESRKTTTKTTKTKAIKPIKPIKVDVDKKKRTNPYIDYIKEKMPEMKDEPKGTKLTAIRQMWSIEKAFTALN
jgi:hypothetical protein